MPAAAPPEGASWWKQAVGRLTGAAKDDAPAHTGPEMPADPAPPGGPGSGSPATLHVSPPAAPLSPARWPATATAASPSLAPAPTPTPAAPAEAAARVSAPPVTVPRAIAPIAAPTQPSAALPASRLVAAWQPAAAAAAATTATAEAEPAEAPEARQRWLDKLRSGLRKTGAGITQVFTGTRIDEALYEELEAALLMADAGPKATEFLLQDLKRRVKDARAGDPAAVKALLADALVELLAPLEKSLEVGRHEPTVMMVVGVNGAGKTTSIGKLTRHLADAGQSVLLAAADTFRAAAREQLAVWADRNRVEIVSQQGADPAAVAFDAVTAGKARGRDVVIADTAGRLPTQLHLMEELKKIRRVINKADAGAPHEVLLVVDGNTGQNALAQVKAFDDALRLTGLIVTKLDGTAKGGVLAAIALWSRERARIDPSLRPVPVYFIGVGERLEDLQTFDAREFAQALLN